VIAGVNAVLLVLAATEVADLTGGLTGELTVDRLAA